MRSIVLRVALGIAALTAACSTDAIAPKTTAASAQRSVIADAANVSNLRQQVDQYISVSCANAGADETIHVTGELRYDVHSTQDATGVVHLNIKSNTSGLTGIGLTSGTLFRGMLAEHINSKAEDYLNENVRTTDIIRLVAQGSEASYTLTVTSHFVIDQGTYVLWDDTWNEVCR